MIQIQPETDKTALQALCETAKITYAPSVHGAVMYDGKDKLGYSLFDLYEGYAVILCLEPAEDLALADGMLRSTIHMALNHRCLSVYYADTAPEETFAQLGFIMNRAEKRLNTYKLFGTCKDCD